jgi:hypothetical protein
MTTVNLSDSIYRDAQLHARAQRRSVPKQIEYWAQIGKIAEENPDLPYAFIKQLLLTLQEVDAGETVPFDFT